MRPRFCFAPQLNSIAPPGALRARKSARSLEIGVRQTFGSTSNALKNVSAAESRSSFVHLGPSLRIGFAKSTRREVGSGAFRQGLARARTREPAMPPDICHGYRSAARARPTWASRDSQCRDRFLRGVPRLFSERLDIPGSGAAPRKRRSEKQANSDYFPSTPRK